MRRFLGLSSSPSSAPEHLYTGPISGNDAIDPYRPEDVLTIKHGANEYLFKYPVNTIATHALTVGHVREKCAEITGVNYNRLNLICAGRQLKDDDVTLKTLGIEHGAKLLCMGSNAAPPSMPVPKHQHSSGSLRSVRTSHTTHEGRPRTPAAQPSGPAEKIEAVREEVVTKLLPMVDAFIGNMPQEMGQREDTHRRLGETIMAELLKLDGVETEDNEIRARRKEVVKEIQGVLDALDRAIKEPLGA